MNSINKLTAALGAAFGGVLITQSAIAGSGCPHAAWTQMESSGKYSQAVYRPGVNGPAAVFSQPAGVTYVGMGYGSKQTDAAGHSAGPDIVDTAISAGGFDTLVAAVKAAGLVDTLKGKGPFTLFAPTDAAFAKLPSAQLDALLKDKAALTKVLTYHVVAGRVDASQVVGLDSAMTVEGQRLTIRAGDSVMVNDATVIKTDIETSNGIIHVIDRVMLPPDMLTRM